MNRMFEQSREVFSQSRDLFSQELSWWTEQVTQRGTQAVSQGEKLYQLGGELVSEMIKGHSQLFETVGKRAQQVGQRQAELWQGLFKQPEA